MPNEIVLGTANKDKLAELQSLLRQFKIRVIPVHKLGRLPRVVENGRTFEANAAKKARAYSRLSDKLTLADDSGLCVTSLNRRPGVYSARFAGPGCSYQDNNRKLLRLLNRPGKRREAAFHSVVALYRNGKRIRIVRGVCRGRIAYKTLGKNGFGYDPIFIPKGYQKTFAELKNSQKNRISHRGKALALTKRFLKSYFRAS